MRGNHCREQIAVALESVAGVKEVDVNLYRARATIIADSPCEPAELIRTVLGTGYGASLVGGKLGVESQEARNDQNQC
jgi:copper chaperone CopZ